MKQFKQDLIGVTSEEAVEIIKKQNFISRIVSVNGAPKIVTRDYKTNRINLYLQDGIVVKTTIG